MKNLLSCAPFVYVYAAVAVLFVLSIVFIQVARATTNVSSVHLDRASGNYLEASSTPAISLAGDITLEAWVKFASLPAEGKTYTILAKWGALSGPGSDANDSFALWFQKNSGVYQLQIASDSGSSHQGRYVNWTPSTNTWYHVAVVYSSAGSSTLYIDGNYQGMVTALPTIQSTTVPLLIGQYGEAIANDPSEGFFDGLIDDIRIYDIARTQSDIQSDYNVELNGNETNLTAYWKLDNSFDASTPTTSPLIPHLFSSDVPF